MVVIGNLLPMLPSTYSFRGTGFRASYKSSTKYIFYALTYTTYISQGYSKTFFKVGIIFNNKDVF